MKILLTGGFLKLRQRERVNGMPLRFLALFLYKPICFIDISPDKRNQDKNNSDNENLNEISVPKKDILFETATPNEFKKIMK